MKNKKSKLLFVSTRFPLPLHSGFANKNFNFLKNFSKTYEITLLVITRDMPSEADINEMKNYVHDIKIYQPSIKDYLIGLFHSVVKLYPIQFFLFFSLDAYKEVKKIADDYDILFGSVIRSWIYLDDLKVPKFFDLADSLAQTYRRNYKTLNNPIYKFIYFIEHLLMHRVEKKLIKNSKSTFLFNRKEAQLLSKYGRVDEVPHGVHDFLINDVSPNYKYKNDVIIFGKMDFHPNVDAAFWFVENILDTLPKDINLIIIGVSPIKKILELQEKNNRVKVLGFVEDPYSLICGSLASIAPIRLGGGIQNKVLESLAIGANVIISEMVAESLPEIDSSGVIVCKNVQDWTSEIIKIYKSKDKYQNSSKRKIYIKERYTWDAYSRKIKNTIEETLS